MDDNLFILMAPCFLVNCEEGLVWYIGAFIEVKDAYSDCKTGLPISGLTAVVGRMPRRTPDDVATLGFSRYTDYELILYRPVGA